MVPMLHLNTRIVDPLYTGVRAYLKWFDMNSYHERDIILRPKIDKITVVIPKTWNTIWGSGLHHASHAHGSPYDYRKQDLNARECETPRTPPDIYSQPSTSDM